MLDKLLGVSPSPQQEATRDPKKPDRTAKNEFEKLLNPNNQQKDTKNKLLLSKKGKYEELGPTKKENDKKENDKEELVEKSSRGIKKKMTEVDKTVSMISNVMASPESEFEVPDIDQDLATIETNPETLTKLEVPVKQKEQEEYPVDLGPMGLQLMNLHQTEELVSSLEASESPIVDSAIAFENVQASLETVQDSLEMQPQIEQDAVLRSEVAQITAKPAIDFVDQNIEQKIVQTLEDSGLLQQVKEFEEAQGLTGEQANEFELKIMNQLKAEYQQLQQSVIQSPKAQTQVQPDSPGLFQQSQQKENSSHFSNDGSKAKAAPEPVAEIKPDSLKAESLLHTGQSHHLDFKAQMIAKSETVTDPSKLAELEAQQDKNIQEVMKQAQYLVRKGGGEMTVKMSPDGIGEVQLKVMLDGGKINIEMQTQDRSIKKMIEDSLSELKSGLAAQRLNVEHVKIDTVNATNTEQRAFLENNLGQSGSQFEQREFWKQFQENFGNQARRSSYGEISSTERIQQRSEPEALKPIHYSQNTYRANGRTGSTLNQVA